MNIKLRCRKSSRFSKFHYIRAIDAIFVSEMIAANTAPGMIALLIYPKRDLLCMALELFDVESCSYDVHFHY